MGTWMLVRPRARDRRRAIIHMSESDHDYMYLVRYIPGNTGDSIHRVPLVPTYY
eukprot:COSAG02_NODE_364_length_23758_cov_17.250011_7_plen_54_part_00